MTSTLVRDNICVEPRYLDTNLGKYIYSKVIEKYMGKCNQEHGYVLSVDKKIKIFGNTISNANENIFFDVGFTVNSLKPKPGQKHIGKVCMIISDGIFVEVKKYLKILIPLNKLKDFKYVSIKNVYKNGEDTLSIGDLVELEITNVKYEKKIFNCIGAFVKKMA